MFRYGGYSKNRDLILVGRVHTSRCDCPFYPSTSWLHRLAPYSFNTAATPPAAHPPGLCLLLMAWHNDRECMCGCFCLCVGSSCLSPLSFQEHATPSHRLSGGLGDRLHPATHCHKCWLSYQSPSGDCARPRFPGIYAPGISTSRAWCHRMSLSC